MKVPLSKPCARRETRARPHDGVSTVNGRCAFSSHPRLPNQRPLLCCAPPMPTLTVDDPFTLETAFTVELADEAKGLALLDRAHTAARAFRTSTVDQRMALVHGATKAMEARADDIAADISRMMGKPVAQGKNEVAGMAQR